MTRARTWKMVYKSPGRGLRFFVQLIDGEREGIPRVAVADNSGETPDRTEDGVLWLDLDRPWMVRTTSFMIPIKRLSGGGESSLWTGESNEALFGLLRALRLPEPEGLGEMAHKIVCRADAADGGLGARAIVKCLALGVESL